MPSRLPNKWTYERRGQGHTRSTRNLHGSSTGPGFGRSTPVTGQDSSPIGHKTGLAITGALESRKHFLIPP